MSRLKILGDLLIELELKDSPGHSDTFIEDRVNSILKAKIATAMKKAFAKLLVPAAKL